MATTVVNEFELLSGVRNLEQRKTVNELLGWLSVLPLDRGAAQQAAQVRASLDGKGAPIGMGDCLIAGVCLARSLPLLTRNRRHFSRVSGLRLLSS